MDSLYDSLTSHDLFFDLTKTFQALWWTLKKCCLSWSYVYLTQNEQVYTHTVPAVMLLPHSLSVSRISCWLVESFVLRATAKPYWLTQCFHFLLLPVWKQVGWLCGKTKQQSERTQHLYRVWKVGWMYVVAKSFISAFKFAEVVCLKSAKVTWNYEWKSVWLNKCEVCCKRKSEWLRRKRKTEWVFNSVWNQVSVWLKLFLSNCENTCSSWAKIQLCAELSEHERRILVSVCE